MNKENKEYLKELTQFLTADAWSEDRIFELLTNVYIKGSNDGHNETMLAIQEEEYCKCH
jgi:hypothetical protein